jgi:CRISPR-associated protein Csd1
MILQALVDYYEVLARKGEIARPGWANVKVSYALEIDENGRLLQVLPLKTEKQVGKKTVMEPRPMELPAPTKRTVGIDANFLWDNSAYFLGFDGKGKPERARQCFDAAKERHISILNGLNDKFASAICHFFESWEVPAARENTHLTAYIDDLEKGANLVFWFNGEFPNENNALSQAWQSYYDGDDGSGEQMRCLVTGEKVTPVPTHPAVKGVQGAQSSGAALVSFNAPAFCSYEREQNINAPVGKYAAFAYTTALNRLLADTKHVKRIGDTTVVYWARDAEERYQDAFSKLLDGGDENIMTDDDMDYFMNAITRGDAADWDGIPLHPDNRFYVLGLAPNAARLSVRFFLSDGFGNFVQHIKNHYDNLKIVSDGRSKWQNIPLWALLRETVNGNASDKSSSPQMSGDTLRAVLTGGRYPATLYQQTLLRIRAEQKINHGRAAIIKAYLLRNTDREEYKEALKVELNESTTYQPYVLGRLFSVLAEIQERASGVTTIKDRYFTSACATPAVVFPTLLKLAEAHMKKMDGGLRTSYKKQLGELTSMITENCPAHLPLYDQGIFQLGYYHQTQKRYEKKNKTADTVILEENEEDK